MVAIGIACMNPAFVFDVRRHWLGHGRSRRVASRRAAAPTQRGRCRTPASCRRRAGRPQRLDAHFGGAGAADDGPGLALFYGGLVRKKNVLGVMMQCFFLMGLNSVIWALWGYSLAFGGDPTSKDFNPWIGNGDYLLMRSVERPWNPKRIDGKRRCSPAIRSWSRFRG